MRDKRDGIDEGRGIGSMRHGIFTYFDVSLGPCKCSKQLGNSVGQVLMPRYPGTS